MLNDSKRRGTEKKYKGNAYENIAVEGPNTNDEIIQEIDKLIEENQSSIKRIFIAPVV
ncbi:12927_t:CDS:2 [Gigaspora rosea]|nr:12927_t:CDS:2 [Gigaspora rosea]